ncbi:hypothetical protein SESBI_38449 [Sesbania bispinosa]|nr:hypothetical protein SESBI_38449 [Sesbania bispinosa]
MGNCLRKNQILAQDEDEEGKRDEKIKGTSLSKLEKARREGIMKKKVRFKVEDHSSSSSGGMRIRLVVTKGELKRVLRNKNIGNNDAQHTSLAQLLSEMRLREKRVSTIEENYESLNSWRPALESIPEDHSMK